MIIILGPLITMLAVVIQVQVVTGDWYKTALAFAVCGFLISLALLAGR